MAWRRRVPRLSRPSQRASAAPGAARAASAGIDLRGALAVEPIGDGLDVVPARDADDRAAPDRLEAELGQHACRRPGCRRSAPT